MKRKILLTSVLTATLLVTGCMGGGRAPQSEIEAVVPTVPVEVEALSSSLIKEEFYSLGSVEAGRTYSMTSLVNADVDKVYVSVGDVVKKGDLLFELETDDFNTSRTSQVSGVKAQLDNAKIQRDSAEKAYNDTKILFEQGAASKSTLDQTEDAYNSAKISYNNAYTSYNTTISSLSSSEENYIVTSPIDGIVTSRTVEEGQFATTQNGVTIAEYNPVKIVFSVPSARIDETYIGQPVFVEFPTQDLELEGELTRLNLSGKAGGYPAEIELVNDDEKLLPGMIAEVYIETNRDEEAYVVSKNTVLEDEEGHYVFVVRGEKAMRVNVETGIENGPDIQITGEINTGDQLVIKGQQYLQNEDLVVVK